MFIAGVLTISDKGWLGERKDESGLVAQDLIKSLSIPVERYEIVPDDINIISAKLKDWADVVGLDLIITSGGTGLSPRDVTPEAMAKVIDRVVPGIAEAMRMETMKKTPMAMLSRAIAGARGKTLIINLPGSPKGVRECLEVVLPVIPHALDILAGKTFEGAHDGGK
jgi:molybdenum cofactor synthesis domain-containing protein